MWRREMTRWVLAINWIVAGISFSYAVYTYGRFWGINCDRMAREDMDRIGIKPDEEQHYSDQLLVRKMEYLNRTRLTADWGRNGWSLACICSVSTAIALMVCFPKRPPEPRKVRPKGFTLPGE